MKTLELDEKSQKKRRDIQDLLNFSYLTYLLPHIKNEWKIVEESRSCTYKLLISFCLMLLSSTLCIIWKTIILTLISNQA